uniref:Putative membrane protein n=1 Tax=Streptomyces sp. UC 11065 TaxID=428401 RepID=A3R4U2_9ACTN|nr:putative membrane protein [Streptomyces sp. UC 11065]
MTNDSAVDREGGGSAPHPSAEPLPKRIGPAIVGGIVFMTLFLWIVGAAIHSPDPKDLPLGVVGDQATVQQFEQQADKNAPGALDVKDYADLNAAKEALKDQDVLGVFAPGPDGPQLFVTGASGQTPKNFLTTMFTQMAQQQGQVLQVTDLAPLPSGDSLGFVAFFTFAGITVGSLGFQVIFSQRRARRLRAVAGGRDAFSVLVGITAIAIDRWILDSFPDEFWALSGLAALYALIIVACVAVFQWLGPVGVPLAAITFLMFGLGSSGGGVNHYFLPDLYAALNDGMPAGNLVAALRRVAYMDGSSLGGPLTVLIIWAVAAVAVVGIGGFLRDRRRGQGGGPLSDDKESAPVTA